MDLRDVVENIGFNRMYRNFSGYHILFDTRYFSTILKPSAKNFPLNFCLKLERQAKNDLQELLNDPDELEKGITNIFIKALLILNVKRSSYESVEWKEVSTCKGDLHRDCSNKIKKIRETLTAVSWELNRVLELKGFINKSHNFHAPDAQESFKIVSVP